MQDIDAFVRSHRQQIRDITECCKEETTLLSKLTTSGLINASHSSSDDLSLDDASHRVFLEYVFSLDGLLERKLRAMSDLRQSVKALLQQQKLS